MKHYILTNDEDQRVLLIEKKEWSTLMRAFNKIGECIEYCKKWNIDIPMTNCQNRPTHDQNLALLCNSL